MTNITVRTHDSVALPYWDTGGYMVKVIKRKM